jgi:hypothetical protein
MGYEFKKLGVVKAQKLAADATNPEQVKVTFADGNTTKIDLHQNVKVCSALRPGVEVDGFFQRMMPWKLEGNDGAITGTALVGVVITKVGKGQAIAADIDAEIEVTDWIAMQAKDRPIAPEKKPVANGKNGGEADEVEDDLPQ